MNSDGDVSIRELTRGGMTLEEIRKAVFQADSNPNWVLVRAKDDPDFPGVCPNCGQPASSWLNIERAVGLLVEGDSDTPNETFRWIGEFRVPFCEPCLRQHRSEQKPQSFWLPFRRILSRGEGLGALFVVGIGFFFLKEALLKQSLILLVFSGLPLSVGGWVIRSVWNKTRHMAVRAPTSVELAVDFTSVLALEFEPGWRAFQFRSKEYAERFRQTNQHRIWNPNSEEARSAALKRKQRSARTNLIVGVIVGAVMLWYLWAEWLSPYLLPLLQR